MLTFLKKGTEEDYLLKNLIGESTFCTGISEKCSCGQNLSVIGRFLWTRAGGIYFVPNIEMPKDSPSQVQRMMKECFEVFQFCLKCDEEDPYLKGDNYGKR